MNKVIANEQFTIPLYRGQFIIMFTNGEIPVADYYDDLKDGGKIEFAHYFPVNIINKNKPTRRAYLIGFNLTSIYRLVDHGAISHEVFHAVSHVMHTAGISLSEESEEAYAYLIDWMTEKVYEVVKKYKIKITPNKHKLS